ncbi:MAG: hypothetical protein IPK67_19570 [Planctomycetes bacterium]|nr:hypothetical protein [Planctomycetota bacterium]
MRARLDHLSGLGVATIWLMPLCFRASGPPAMTSPTSTRSPPAYGDTPTTSPPWSPRRTRWTCAIVDLPFNHVHRSHPLVSGGGGRIGQRPPLLVPLRGPGARG